VAHKFANILFAMSRFFIIRTAQVSGLKSDLEVILMMNENVVNLLKTSMWDLATCANGEPNVVPVAFKDITEDGKLVVGDVFLETTLNNIKANNGKIAISVYDPQNLEGYQIKGSAEYVSEGAVVDTFKAMVEKMFNGAATAKGALIITPEKVIVTTPGADNKKVL
jgi:predicted pyridoxine 5'-phosphate oxidase superfamily flavin-nucleotide-binding protein